MVNDVILNTGEKLVRNKEATIKKILQSAKDEFTEHGFEQASVRIIAKNAGAVASESSKYVKSRVPGIPLAATSPLAIIPTPVAYVVREPEPDAPIATIMRPCFCFTAPLVRADSF